MVFCVTKMAFGLLLLSSMPFAHGQVVPVAPRADVRIPAPARPSSGPNATPGRQYPSLEETGNRIQEAEERIESVRDLISRITGAQHEALLRFEQMPNGLFRVIFCERATDSCEQIGRTTGYTEAEIRFLERSSGLASTGTQFLMYGSVLYALGVGAVHGARASQHAHNRVMAWHQGDMCAIEFANLEERKAVKAQGLKLAGVAGTFSGMSGVGVWYVQANDVSRAVAGARASEEGGPVRKSDLRERLELGLRLVEYVPGLPRPTAAEVMVAEAAN